MRLGGRKVSTCTEGISIVNLPAKPVARDNVIKVVKPIFSDRNREKAKPS